MRSYFLGNRVKEPSLYMMIMKAAGGDPLKAQAIADNLCSDWWQYWLAWQQEESLVAAEKAVQAGRR